MNGKSNDSSFHHPAFIEEDPEKLIEIENINLNSENKNLTNPDIIPLEINNSKPTQEISGHFQDKPPDLTPYKPTPIQHTTDALISKGERESVARKVSLHEEKNKVDDIPKQLSTIKQENEDCPSCLKSFFVRQKKFDKIRVYFGPNATQDAVYKHPGNHVRTTKFNYFRIFFSNVFKIQYDHLVPKKFAHPVYASCQYLFSDHNNFDSYAFFS